MTDDEELACANQIIFWLKEFQTTRRYAALAGLNQTRLVKLAWKVLRYGIHTRNDLEAHLTQEAQRQAEIDLAWAARNANAIPAPKTESTAAAFSRNFTIRTS